MLLDPVSLGIAAASLLLVIALAVGLGRALRLAGAARSGGGRLAVIEVVAVDPRRRLVLLRYDGREALVLTGPAGDLLLEAPR